MDVNHTQPFDIWSESLPAIHRQTGANINPLLVGVMITAIKTLSRKFLFQSNETPSLFFGISTYIFFLILLLLNAIVNFFNEYSTGSYQQTLQKSTSHGKMKTSHGGEFRMRRRFFVGVCSSPPNPMVFSYDTESWQQWILNSFLVRFFVPAVLNTKMAVFWIVERL